MKKTISRRTFVKAGLIGALALAAAGGLYRATKKPSIPDGFILESEARSALAAIAAVILKGTLQPMPSGAVDAEINRVLGAIAGLPRVTQSEIQDLFGLLTLAPTKRLLVGIASSWAEAKPAEIADFLQSWRVHRFTMLQSAYHALHDLIIGAWYADESTWASIGYPGPIKELS